MDSPVLTPTTCRFCAFYHSEGRRGGTCEKLNVPVRGFWRACPLATAPAAVKQATPSLHAVATPATVTASLFFFEDDPEATL